MTKINTIFLVCYTYPWLKVIELLKQNIGVEPVYYIERSHDLFKDKMHHCYPECFYQTLEDAWKGKGFPNVKKCSLDEKILKSVAHEEIIFLRMLDRLDADGHTFSLINRHFFFTDLLKTWLQIIDEKEIELIISPSIPHRGFDYALYIAAKIRGIEFIMFQMTPFEDSSFLLDNVNHTPSYFKKDLLKFQDGSKLRMDIKQRIDHVKLSYDIAIPSYMTKQSEILEKRGPFFKIYNILNLIKKCFIMRNRLFNEIYTYRVKKDVMPRDSKTLYYQNMINQLKWEKHKEKLRDYYQRQCTAHITEPYILVALHYQPEETSCPTGGSYVDQLLIIDMLDAHLEDSIKIVVKEHKSQFHPSLEGESGRTINFYKRLTDISSRVKLVSANTDPFTLIDRAIATVTISGTIGWESVIRGTPAIIFGRAWYEDMPYVFKVKTNEDFLKIWPKITHLKNRMSQKQIEDFHIGLQRYLVDADHYGKESERDSDESAFNIYNGIIKHLMRKGWNFEVGALLKP